MGVKLVMKGFDSMLDKIKAASGDIDSAAKECAVKTGEILREEYKNAIVSSGVSPSLANRMPANRVIQESPNKTRVEVGYPVGSYNPNNPSDAFIAMFLNYGTPRISPRGFLPTAKKKAAPKAKAEQKKVLEEILGELE